MDELLNASQMGADTDIIKQASRLIVKGERLEALVLLEQAVRLQPLSRLLLQAAGRLCLQQGESARAAAYLERALAVNNTPAVDSYDQHAVDEADFDYLEEQAQDLAECDYVIPGLEPDAPLTSSPKSNPQKTLTLHGRQKDLSKDNAPDRIHDKASNDSELVGFDDRPSPPPDLSNVVIDEKTVIPELNNSGSSEIVSESVQPDLVIPELIATKVTDHESPADTNLELATPSRSILKIKKRLPETAEPEANIKLIIKRRPLLVDAPEQPDELVQPSFEPEGLPDNRIVLGSDVKVEPVVLVDAPAAISEPKPKPFSDEQPELLIELESGSEHLPTLGIVMELVDESFIDIDDFESEESDDSAKDFLSDSASSHDCFEFELDDAFDSDDYGLWDDMQAGVVETKDEERLLQEPEVGVSRSERARQKAVEVIVRVGWEADQLEFLTQVFIENGWGAARIAIEREIQAGTTFEQLELAREIRLVWKECDRYWITFSKLNAFSQVTDAAYYNLSWSLALRIIGVFQYIPCTDELESFLDDEFEFWYSNKILRLRYPAFIKYLNYYRINSDYPHLSADDVRCFDWPVSYDAMSSDEFMYTHSDAVEQLRGYGINVFADYAPKNYYVTDEIFDPAIFDNNKNDQPVAAEEDQGNEL